MMQFTPIDHVLDGITSPLFIPPKPAITTVIGVVVGDQDTAPAICAVRYDSRVVYGGDPLCGEAPIWQTDYTVLGTERLSVGTSYPLVAARVNTLAQRLYSRDDRGDYHVLADAFGAGRPVIAAMRDSILASVHVTAVTVNTGDIGDLSILWRAEATIGLTYLVSRLQAVLQGNRLHVPRSPATDTLLAQLRDYQVDGANGPDMVRALSLCCASEYAPVRYDRSIDQFGSPVL